MRLVCPSCATEYEIEDSLVPSPGREVQCSSCGHQWFQNADGSIAPSSAAGPAPAGSRDRGPAADRGTDLAEDDEEEEAPRPLPERRVDPEVLSVLRDEALREREARRKEAPARAGKESAPASDVATPDHEETASEQAAPDVDAVNAALRSISEREHAASAAARARAQRRSRRSGFRLGFLAALLVGLLAVALYVFAAELSARAPAAAPWIEAYAGFVAELRDGLEALADRIATAVRGTADG